MIKKFVKLVLMVIGIYTLYIWYVRPHNYFEEKEISSQKYDDSTPVEKMDFNRHMDMISPENLLIQAFPETW